MDQHAKNDCCNLSYNFSETDKPRWLLSINVNDTLMLTPSLIEAVVFYDTLKRFLNSDDSWKLHHNICEARHQGSLWDKLQIISISGTGESFLHIVCGPMSAFVSLVRMGQIFKDLQEVLIQSLGKEPRLEEYVPSAA